MSAIKEIFQKIEQALKADPSKIGGLTAVYQFNLSGEEPGVYQIVLRSDSADVIEGQQETPNCTFILSSEDFKDLVAGKLNGMTAFMSGKLRVEGDVSLAMRLESLLGGANPA